MNFSVQRKCAGSVVGVCLHWDYVVCGKRGSTPPTAGRRSSQPIEVESASSVGNPVAPVGPVRVGELFFDESANVENMTSFLERRFRECMGVALRERFRANKRVTWRL